MDTHRHIINLEAQLGRLEKRLAHLQVENTRLIAEHVVAKDRQIAGLETQQRHLETRLHFAESEVKALKRSWSYRVGRVFVFPASMVKLGLQRLRRLQEQPPAPVHPTPVTCGLDSTQEELARMHDAYQRLTVRPLISILVPVYNTPPALLRATLDSVLAQVYQEWELCLADDGSTSQETLAVLEEYCIMEPQRIKLTRLRRNGGIAVASNAAADLATGEFVALLDHDDLLTADALLEVAQRLEKVPDADLVYSDEDKVTMDGRLEQPAYKPDFSPEHLLSCNYICHFTTMRRTVFEQAGRFRAGFDGSQDYDLFLRVTEIARRVEHIPKILYHWRMAPGSAATDVYAKGGPWRDTSHKALRAAIARRGWRAEVLNGIVPGMYRVKFAVDPAQRVTIIIPIKDKIELLQACVESIRKHTTHPSYEILVISNNSEEERTYAYLERATRQGILRFLRYDVPFNYAAINNFAVRNCDSPYVLFLNNDTVVDSNGWLTSMLEFAQQEAIGAVGAKLLYPNGTVQHAGVILGIKGVASHSHLKMPADQHGYLGYANMIRNYSAVTAACLLTRRDVFEKVGGFDEQLAVVFNDVDFCLEIRKAGYRIVYTPYARLYHHESASRGNGDSPDHAIRYWLEVAYMLAKWGAALYNDPYYNPNLTLWGEDFSLKTAAEEEKWRDFARQFPPSAYKAVWNQLSLTETEAKLHVVGSVHEEDFSTTARETLGVLEASVGIRREDVILEVGCGVGRMGAVLAPHCQQWIGCDVSGNMLRYAAARLSRLHNVKLVETSGYDLRPVQDTSVDLVYCTVVFMHLDEWDRYNYVLEAKRVLRSGGRLFIDNFDLCSEAGWSVFEQHRAIPPEKRPPHISRSSTPQELATYLQRAGFRSVSVQQSHGWVRGWGIK